MKNTKLLLIVILFLFVGVVKADILINHDAGYQYINKVLRDNKLHLVNKTKESFSQIKFDFDLGEYNSQDELITFVTMLFGEYGYTITKQGNKLLLQEYEAPIKQLPKVKDITLSYVDFYSLVDNIDSDNMSALITSMFGDKYKFSFIDHKLFISLSKTDLKRLKIALQEYDIKKRNLLVNLLIVNASDNALDELGTNLDAMLLGQHQFNFRNTTTDILDSGLILSGRVNIFNYVFKYLKTKNRSFIKAKPSLVVLSGKTANFVVGSNVPLKTSENQNDNNDKTTTKIKRQDIGLKLSVAPYYRFDGTIDIKLTAEQSSLIGSIDGATDLSYNKQSITTLVNVSNNSMLILGGLTSETNNRYISQIPILSRIPVIGRIFRYTKKNKNKANLMLFIKVSTLNHNINNQYLDKKPLDNKLLVKPYENKKLRRFLNKKHLADIY